MSLIAILDVLAALMVAMLPAALLFWLLIHPLARFWRRLGPLVSYVIAGGLSAAVAWAIWTRRDSLMDVHYGYRPLTITLGILVFVLAAIWDVRVQRLLRFPILAGLPELSEGRPGELLTGGPYAVVRHPRYLGLILGVTGFALVVNYLAVYAAVALTFPMGYLVMVLEERELRQRFGAEYEAYCRRVPRILPRRSGGSGT